MLLSNNIKSIIGNTILIVVLLIILFFIIKLTKPLIAEEDAILKGTPQIVDTIHEIVYVDRFIVKDRTFVKHDIVLIPQKKKDSLIYLHDSIAIKNDSLYIPIYTNIYEDSICSVQVSGYNTNVDWVKIHNTTITKIRDYRIQLSLMAGANYDMYSRTVYPGLKFNIRLRNVEFNFQGSLGYSIPNNKLAPQMIIGVDIPIWNYKK